MNTNKTSKKIRNIITRPLLWIKKIFFGSVLLFLVFAFGNVIQCHTVQVTASIQITPQVVSLTLNFQQSHNAMGPQDNSLHLCVFLNFTEEFLHSKSFTTIIS